MWDLPRSGLEPVSPALAGGFLTTTPPGKSPNLFLQGHQSYWIKAHPITSFNLNYLFKNISPNTVTFWGTGLRTSTGEFGGGEGDTIQPIMMPGTHPFYSIHITNCTECWCPLTASVTISQLLWVLAGNDSQLPPLCRIFLVQELPCLRSYASTPPAAHSWWLTDMGVQKARPLALWWDYVVQFMLQSSLWTRLTLDSSRDHTLAQLLPLPLCFSHSSSPESLSINHAHPNPVSVSVFKGLTLRLQISKKLLKYI